MSNGRESLNHVTNWLIRRSLTSLTPDNSTYYALKHTPDSAYQSAKAILRGVAGNMGHFTAEFANFGGFSTTVGDEATPFRGWLLSGKPYESFTAEGVRRHT